MRVIYQEAGIQNTDERPAHPPGGISQQQAMVTLTQAGGASATAGNS